MGNGTNENQNKTQGQGGPQGQTVTAPATNTPVDAKVGISLTAAEITEIIAAAMKAAKEPSEEEKAVMAAEAEKRAIQKKQWREEAQEWLRQREADQARCAHRKPRGELAAIGKLFSDGHWRVICLQCAGTLEDVDATKSPELFARYTAMEAIGVSWESFRGAPSAVVVQADQVRQG